MKILVPKRMFILTTDSYIAAEELAREKDYIVKGFVIDKHPDFDAFRVAKLEYVKPKTRFVKSETPKEIKGFKVFHGIVHVKPESDNVGVLSDKLEFIPYQNLQPGVSFITIIKHIIADVQAERYSRTRQKELVEIEVYDLPSIVISADESGSSTILLVNKNYYENH